MYADQTAVLSASNSGDNTVIAAPTDGRRIAVKAIHGQAAGTVSVTWKNGSTAMTGAVPQAANTGYVLAYCGSDYGSYWFVLSANTALVCNLSTTVLFAGHVVYRLIGGPG